MRDISEALGCGTEAECLPNSTALEENVTIMDDKNDEGERRDCTRRIGGKIRRTLSSSSLSPSSLSPDTLSPSLSRSILDGLEFGDHLKREYDYTSEERAAEKNVSETKAERVSESKDDEEIVQTEEVSGKQEEVRVAKGDEEEGGRRENNENDSRSEGMFAGSVLLETQSSLSTPREIGDVTEGSKEVLNDDNFPPLPIKRGIVHRRLLKR